jgi:hypothetical protein
MKVGLLSSTASGGALPGAPPTGSGGGCQPVGVETNEGTSCSQCRSCDEKTYERSHRPCARSPVPLTSPADEPKSAESLR